MATGLAAISSSASSSFHSLFKHSSLFDSSRTSIEGSSYRVTVRLRRSLNSRSYPGTILTVRSAICFARSAEEDWKIKREVLLQKRVRSVDVKEALRLQQENNIIILDGRPEAEFKGAHPPGATNVRIYMLIEESTTWDIARRAAFAFFGIFAGTEENPDLLKSVESQIEKDAKIIVACTTGGTMRPSQNLPEKQQPRSLIAAYLLILNGFTNIYHLEGGLNTWFMEGLPTSTKDCNIP